MYDFPQQDFPDPFLCLEYRLLPFYLLHNPDLVQFTSNLTIIPALPLKNTFSYT